MTTQERATFAFGGFWAAEAAYRHREGVLDTRVGYMGGLVANPMPEEVARNTTGHAEVVEVTFDPTVISYAALLRIFWAAHDATLAPGDAVERRHRFRSAIFVHSAEQEQEAVESRIAQEAEWGHPVVTSIAGATTFWPAPDEQQHRLEKGGMYAFGALGSGLRPPHPDSPSDPQPSAADAAVLHEFGGALGGLCSAGWIKLMLLQNEQHFAVAVRGLRDWLATHENLPTDPAELEGVATYPETGLPRSGQAGRRGLFRAVTIADRGAAHSTLLVSRSGAHYVFLVNHQPGSSLPRLGRDIYARATRPSLDREGGEVRTFAGQGHANPESDPTGRPVGPRPRRATAAEPVSGESWHEHIPPGAFRFDCGGPEPHVVRWAGGTLEIGLGPDQAVRERAMVALGADRCWCLHMIEAWDPRWMSEAWVHDLPRSCDGDLGHALGRPAFGPGDADPHARPPVSPNTAAHLLRTPLPDPSSARELADSQDLTREVRQAVFFRVLVQYMNWPTAFRQRWLVAGLAHLESERAGLERFDRRLLETGLLAALRGAIVGSLWQSCRANVAVTYGLLDCRYLERGEAASASGALHGDTARISVGVPFRWLTEVWARSLAIVDEQLVLEVDGPGEAAELDVTVASWCEGATGTGQQVRTRRTTIHWDGDDWHLAPPA